MGPEWRTEADYEWNQNTRWFIDRKYKKMLLPLAVAEKVLERGDHIELLVDKTETLNQQAFHFKKKANTLKKNTWWKNQKYMCILILLIVVWVPRGSKRLPST